MIYLEDLVKSDRHLSLNQIALVRGWLDADWETKDLDENVVKLIRRLVATIDLILPGLSSPLKEGDELRVKELLRRGRK